MRTVLGGDKNWVNVMHADGAGTKSTGIFVLERNR